MNKNLLSLYGLKWNPFAPDLPVEALMIGPQIDSFCWRIENAHVREGGFALITGEPGTGKSVALRVLAERLAGVRDVTVGVLTHPQSNLADFYREMGEIFGVPLKPHNRWVGFKALRERWLAHLDTTLLRPVLLIDEAQEMNPTVLSELRCLSSTRFDSRTILSVVLAGDRRLTDMLRREDLLPLGSRIRTRLVLECASREQMLACLRLMATLCDHALGTYRVMTTMASELLAAAAQRELPQLDEKLYFELFAAPRAAAAPAAPARPASPRRSR